VTRWNPPRTGRVWLDSWAGRTSILVKVLGETPHRYRVAWLESRLGRVAGTQALVPKSAVTIHEEPRDA